MKRLPKFLQCSSCAVPRLLPKRDNLLLIQEIWSRRQNQLVEFLVSLIISLIIHLPTYTWDRLSDQRHNGVSPDKVIYLLVLVASFTLIELATPKIEAPQARLPFRHCEQPMTHGTGGLAGDVGYHAQVH